MRVYHQASSSSHDLLLLRSKGILGTQRELVHELFVRCLQSSNIPIRVELSFVEVSDEEAVGLWHAIAPGLYLIPLMRFFCLFQHCHFV